jgi:hypothetical protein
MDLVYRMSPASILDVGAGFGRWGFLCRCHIGVGESLQLCPGQSLRIDAVEGFKPNVSSIYPAVFNNIHLGDARQVVPTLGKYDVIICSHMIEHMPKEDGWKLIEDMLARSNKALILGLPLNEPLRGALRGNDFEAHKSIWQKQDFRGRNAYVKTFPFEGDVKLAVAVFPKSPEAEWATKVVTNPFRRWLSERRQGTHIPHPSPLPLLLRPALRDYGGHEGERE